ncbi:MAG: phosphoglycerate dehydrogenase, partial [Planctomycetota bacterium]
MNSTQEQRPVVLVAEALDEGAVAWLSQRAEVVEAAAAASPERFDEALRRAVGLVVRTYTNVDETLLAKAPQLRVVARAGSGLDNIDVEACSARGVQVVHTP